MEVGAVITCCKRGTAVGLSWVILLWVIAASCSDGLADSSGRAASEVCEQPTAVAILSDDLAEASGISRDPRRDDVFWLHNDSGNEALLYAVDTAGRTLGSVPVVAASAEDLEDVSLSECDGAWCLYLADIGDNMAVRQDLYIHRLPLPDIPAAGSGSTRGAPVSPLDTYWIRYPEGPRDAEALVVDAARDELLIVTKGRQDIVELYAADLTDLAALDGPYLMTRIGRLAVPIGEGSQQLITAADLSPDGSRLAVRSYASLYLFEWRGSAAFDTLAAPESASLVAAFEPQGEGLTFTSDGRTLYLASEGRDRRPPQLSRMTCP